MDLLFEFPHVSRVSSRVVAPFAHSRAAGAAHEPGLLNSLFPGSQTSQKFASKSDQPVHYLDEHVTRHKTYLRV